MPVTSKSKDEQALVAAAQRDPARFAALYERYFERVYAYAVSRLHDRSAAEDVTSHVFEHALAHIADFQWRGTPFVAWLYRIAANAIYDRYRQSARESDAAVVDPKIKPAVNAVGASELEAIEQATELSKLVKQLNQDQRDVIVMRFIEERSLREVARALKRSEGAIKQLQLRALENLRKQLTAASAGPVRRTLRTKAKSHKAREGRHA